MAKKSKYNSKAYMIPSVELQGIYRRLVHRTSNIFLTPWDYSPGGQPYSLTVEKAILTSVLGRDRITKILHRIQKTDDRP